jgi:hypothetical protein
MTVDELNIALRPQLGEKVQFLVHATQAFLHHCLSTLASWNHCSPATISGSKLVEFTNPIYDTQESSHDLRSITRHKASY